MDVVCGTIERPAIQMGFQDTRVPKVIPRSRSPSGISRDTTLPLAMKRRQEEFVVSDWDSPNYGGGKPDVPTRQTLCHRYPTLQYTSTRTTPDEDPGHLHAQTLVIDDGSRNAPSTLLVNDSTCEEPRIRSHKSQLPTHFTLNRGNTLPILQWCMAMISMMYTASGLPHKAIQLGSRHLEPVPSEYPWWRKWGNHALTGLANRTFECSYSDLHTGARIYSREFLIHLPWDKLSDDFVFDHQLLSIAMAQGVPIVEFPIPANYAEGVSSISFRRSVQYGIGCLHSLWAAKRARF